MSNLVLYSIPAFVALMVLEIFWARRRANDDIRGYAKSDTLARACRLGLAQRRDLGVAKLRRSRCSSGSTSIASLDLGQPTLWWSWLVLLFAEDCCYYWFHRMHHQIRILWAAHVNHHSSQYFNLSTALRQPLLTPITGPFFRAPLALVGFPPVMILTAQAWSLLYQFWLHTEAIGNAGAARVGS